MTAELVAGIVCLLIVLIAGATGVVGSTQYGAERQKRKRAERELDESKALMESGRGAPADSKEASALLRDRFDRLGKRLSNHRRHL